MIMMTITMIVVQTFAVFDMDIIYNLLIKFTFFRLRWHAMYTSIHAALR
jgi:hypothetical protein